MANSFKNEMISVSRIKRYEQCPLAFKLHYVDKKKGEYSQTLVFGSLLHAVLENLYKWAKEEEFSGFIDPKQIHEEYDRQWKQFNIVGLDEYNEGLEIITDYLKGTEIDCYDILDIEHEFTVEINDYTFNGKIDLVLKVNDNTIRIIDYKSNRQLFTQSEIDSDLQLSIYNIIARDTWKWVKNVELEFHMLRHNRIQKPSKPRTKEECENAIRYMIAIAKRTEDKNTKFEARLNSFCSYCDQCNNCEEFIKVASCNFSVAQTKTVQLNSSLEDLSNYRENLNSIVSILYKKKKDLDDLLKTKLEHEKDVVVGDLTYYVSEPESSYYRMDELVSVLEKFGAKREDALLAISTVNKEKLKRFIESLRKDLDPSKRAKLTAAIAGVENTSVDSPRLNVRKNKLKVDLGRPVGKFDHKPNKKRY